MTRISRSAGAAALGLLLASSGALAQVPARGAQAPPSKGVVLMGRAPVSEKVLEVKLPKPKEGDLADGLHLMVLEDHRTPQVNFTLIIPGAGGYYDPTASPGLASITAAMMREGTATRTSAQISERLESMAASLSVSTGMSSLDATVSGGSLTENVDSLFDLLADVLLHPSFPEQELAKYKQRQMAQITQLRSIPGFLVQELYSKVMYGDHPAGRLFMTADVLGKVTTADLAQFHREHFAPDHAAIAIAGDITYDAARQLVNSRLGSWQKTGTTIAAATDPPGERDGKVYLVDRPKSVQTNFIVAAPAISRTDPDYDVLEVMNQVVGGGPTGRLFVHLREEKGYTYGAYSNLSAGRFRGTWMASTDVRTNVTEPALTDLMAEVTAIRDETVPAKELQDQKRSLVASFALSLESPQRVLNYYVTRWLYHLPDDYWDTYPRRIMGVTAAQVQAAARKYLAPGRVRIIAVGDGEQVEAILRKFGPLEVYDVEGKRKMMIVP